MNELLHILQLIVHYSLHLLAPGAIAWFFFRTQWKKGLAHYACNHACRFRSSTCNTHIRSWQMQHRLPPPTLLLCHCHLFYNGIFPKTKNRSHWFIIPYAYRFPRLFVVTFSEPIRLSKYSQSATTVITFSDLASSVARTKHENAAIS